MAGGMAGECRREPETASEHRRWPAEELDAAAAPAEAGGVAGSCSSSSEVAGPPARSNRGNEGAADAGDEPESGRSQYTDEPESD